MYNKKYKIILQSIQLMMHIPQHIIFLRRLYSFAN